MTHSIPGADFWNDRFQASEYTYGEQPNDFLAGNVGLFRQDDAVLSLAEGEGRNAVFLAQHCREVRGVDFSQEGKTKAMQLAEKVGVTIAYDLADLAHYDMGVARWDAVIALSCHLPEQLRPSVYQAIQAGLKPGGFLLLEGYNQGQLAYDTGGPKDRAFLYSLDELERAFSGYALLVARDVEREVQEGRFHNGLSSVTQFIARKPAA